MKLALEIEFLTGVCRAARNPATEAPDWPPQPDRVFSALVAAWAARGESAAERAALEWLEQQSVPVLRASGHDVRTASDVFVPPNDFNSSTSAKTYLKVLPNRRPRQPRRFPVARPHDTVMLMVWGTSAPTRSRLAHLNAVARDVTYIGHSASLVRCRFVRGELASPNTPRTARNRIYPGRLEELSQAHSEKPARPMIPPAASNSRPVPAHQKDTPAPLIVETLGDVPDIRASALVCRQLRKALMSGYSRAFGEDQVPEVVSGHALDRTPTRNPHLSIQPMAFVGHPHGDGRVFGFALIPPKRSRILESSEFRLAFRQVANYDEGQKRRVLTLDGQPLHAPVRLSPAGDTLKRSLSFDPYVTPARVWASVTPVVLDRHLKRREDEEARELVALACERAGLPRPSAASIRLSKHSAVTGAPPTRPPLGAPRWSNWRVPEPFATRPLVHVVIAFEHDVEGPVLLGAGRFTGFGLCRGMGA